MSWVDGIVTAIRRFLSILPEWAQDALWFPLFVTVVFVALFLLTRRLLPVIGRVATPVLGWVVVGAGAVLLLVDLLIASGYRLARLRPPALLYAYGDIVSTLVIGLVSAVNASASSFARLARLKVVFIILICAGFVWWWNINHCGPKAGAQPCVRPVASWIAGLDNVGRWVSTLSD